MKNYIYICLISILFLLPIFKEAKATEFNAELLYKNGVKENVINPFTYSYDKWRNEIAEPLQMNYDQMKNSSAIDISFFDWVIKNNYGIVAETNNSMFSGKKSLPITARSASDNINRFVKIIKPGDIIYSTKYTLSGFIGHVAMSNGNGWIIEMPGGANWRKGIPDNNNQCTTRQYIKKHIKDWSYVYRISNRSLASKVARYADRKFYSSKGTRKKDRHIRYQIDWYPKKYNPSYCSKLVYYSYYFGSGNLPVMQPMPSIFAPIPPVNVITLFSTKYRLHFIGKY